MYNTSLFLAIKYLKAKGKPKVISIFTWLSFLSIVIGVAALIVVLSVMNGFNHDLKEKILAMKAHIFITSSHSSYISDYEKIINELKNVEGITSLTPFILSQGMIASKTGIDGVVIFGININNDTIKLKEYLIENDKELKEDEIIVGNELAKKLNIRKSDEVNLLIPTISYTLYPKMKKFKVKNLFKSGMYEYDSSFVYLSLPGAQNLFNLPNLVSGIAATVKNIYKSSSIAKKIRIKYSNLWARDWTEMNYTLFSALKLEKNVMRIILTLIIIVAGFNILSTLIMTVTTKVREIGILKSLGMTSQNVMKIFLFQGIIIGVTGAIVGTILGFILCIVVEKQKLISIPQDIYYFSSIPVRIEIIDVILTNFIALIITFLATVHSAIKAARLQPVDAIRYG
jgi:lipoprotein-releasing system permease protein